MGLPVSSFRESCSEYTRLQSLLSCLNCRDAFSFAYDMAELGTDKQTQRSKSTEQGGSGPIPGLKMSRRPAELSSSLRKI